MGAAALVTDREVTDRLRRLHQHRVDWIGRPAVLFETGPANALAGGAVGARAPHPRGGSYALEVYSRLPNDTDFSILKTRDIPGPELRRRRRQLRVSHRARYARAALARDDPRRPARTSSRSSTALQTADITARTSGMPTFFDIGGTVAVSYGTIGALADRRRWR